MIKFSYCECGCKGYSGSVAGLDYWIYWDLKLTYSLVRGHGWSGTSMGNYTSKDAAERVANVDARPHLIKLQKEINAVLENNSD